MGNPGGTAAARAQVFSRCFRLSDVGGVQAHSRDLIVHGTERAHFTRSLREGSWAVSGVSRTTVWEA